MRLFCDQQILRERPLDHQSTEPRSESPQCSPFEQSHRKNTCGCFRSRWFRRRGTRRQVPRQDMFTVWRHVERRMHFHAASVVINLRHVFEVSKIKIAAQFTIDAGQQVQVECSSHSQFVVIRCQQLGTRLLQIGAQQKRISRLENAANLIQGI